MLQSNAKLTKVQSASGGESFDGPAAPGPDKFTGSSDAYVVERRDRVAGPAGNDRVLVRSMIVDNDDPAIDWRSGDIVTYTPTGLAEIVATVRLVERRAVDDPDIPADVQTTRLTLEAA